ncbi:GntR family transcriptional regulator [Chloroflexota bacterium]
MWISINERDRRPMYLQITNQIKEQLRRGTLKPKDELPSVRELAESLSINMHTVRSAYLKLRDQGIINLRLGRRARIAPLQSSPANRDAVAGLQARIKELVTDSFLAGLSPDDLRNLINRQLDELKQD